MSTPLWMSIEPLRNETRLFLTAPMTGTALKARLPKMPAHPRAIVMLMEALSAWYRLPLHAALDADAEGVRLHGEHWAVLVGDLPGLDVSVEWIARPKPIKHDKFLGPMGHFRRARRLISLAATGQR